jgi:hypothetical protein
VTRSTGARGTDLKRAWTIGRGARLRGLDVKAANVNLAHQLGWQNRADFDDALLDECERGWRHEDDLRDERS